MKGIYRITNMKGRCKNKLMVRYVSKLHLYDKCTCTNVTLLLTFLCEQLQHRYNIDATLTTMHPFCRHEILSMRYADCIGGIIKK